jgi:hypothetical protein
MLATVGKHQDYEVAIEIELGRLEGSAMGSAVGLCKLWSKYHVLQREAIWGISGIWILLSMRLSDQNNYSRLK